MGKNIIRCLSCRDVVESKSRHDFRRCKCGKVFTDGGTVYQRIGWPDGKMEDHVEIISSPERFSKNGY